MKFSKTIVYDIEFQVEYYEALEGGMDHGYFGRAVSSMEEALQLLEMANATESDREWQIVLNVSKGK